MSKVTAGFSMSLDGFVADSDDSVEHVFKWYSAGGTDVEVMVGDQAVNMSREGAEYIEEAGRGVGVLVTARRTFDLAHAWGGKHPMDVPMVVLTHTVPEEWANPRVRRLLLSLRELLRQSTWLAKSQATKMSSSVLPA